MRSSEAPAPMRDVEGRVAFITGGSSGVGLGIAHAFINAGMKVVIGYLSESHYDESLKVLGRAGSRLHAIRVDVTDRKDMAAAAAETLKVFGKIHILVNNAGVAPISSLSSATYDDWDWCTGVNVNGAFNGIHTFLPYIKSQNEGGHIVTTASIFGLAVFRFSQGIYSTTKFAVIGMMEALRSELASSGIGASVFCPGPVKSNISDCNRNRPPTLQQTGEPATEELAAIEKDKGELPEGVVNDLDSAMADPLVMGERVLSGIRNNDLYIISHPEFELTIRDRCEALLASIRQDGTPITAARAAAAQLLRNPMYSNELQHKRRD